MRAHKSINETLSTNIFLDRVSADYTNTINTKVYRT